MKIENKILKNMDNNLSSVFKIMIILIPFMLLTTIQVYLWYMIMLIGKKM